MAATSASQAPRGLELVRAFVNSLDIEAGAERLGTPGDLDRWGRENGLGTPQATRDDLGHVVALREALREVLLSHHDRVATPPGALAIIDSAMVSGEVRPSLTVEGLSWVSACDGVPGMIGGLMRAVATAAADGTWTRLKACSNDTCRWAFYDHSRSRTGRWCSMQVCGNRAKQQRFQQSQ